MAPEDTRNKRRLRRVRRGTVVSDVRDKTIKVVYEYSRPHPKYGKIIRRRTTMHVHDPDNQARVGDVVEVMACRPISKQKSWRLIRVAESFSAEPKPAGAAAASGASGM